MSFELVARIVEIVCAIGALLISIIALIKSGKASKIQETVAELDERLKTYELEKVEREKAAQSTACIEARKVKIGKGSYRVRISNTGKARAYNVDFDVTKPDVKGFFYKEKTPYEFLDAHESFDEIIVVCAGFPSKVSITTMWEDENGKEYTRENLLSF